ncbi:hypothetical protein [Ensifer sp. M14]|uniref:hypothetical protein n=1 Tax=Ensifer sp. M14 TaxID=2203782 RepID=UPI0011C063B0|nr:hypothetical protein [Ensifer sp. M14]
MSAIRTPRFEVEPQKAVKLFWTFECCSDFARWIRTHDAAETDSVPRAIIPALHRMKRETGGEVLLPSPEGRNGSREYSRF